jgi:hypothetical protein
MSAAFRRRGSQPHTNCDCPPPSRTRWPRRLLPRPGRMIAILGGLATLPITVIGLAPMASAAYLPPDPAAPSIIPPPLPGTSAAAQLPGPVIAALTAGTVLLSVLTTLATLALVRLRDRRLASASAPEPETAPDHVPDPGELLVFGSGTQ